MCLCPRTISFRMLVRTILTSTICAKFTFDFGMQIKTSLPISTCRKVLTLLRRVNKRTSFSILAISKMLAFYLFFLAQLAAKGPSIYGWRCGGILGLRQDLFQVDSLFGRFFFVLLGAESFHALFTDFIRGVYLVIIYWMWLKLAFGELVVWFLFYTR